MSKQLLYLFGEPGTGKITVARILQERLGWRLFWLHDLDSVCAIVGRYPLPRLMDKISLAILEEMMIGGENIIYVRPSRDLVTVLAVLELAKKQGYISYPIQLLARVTTLVSRVQSREKSRFRISSGAELDQYFQARDPSARCGVFDCCDNVVPVWTDDKTPAQVADVIQDCNFGTAEPAVTRDEYPVGA